MARILMLVCAMLVAWLGGWPWLVIYGAMVGLGWKADPSPFLVVQMSLIALFWLGAHVWSEDRRLYFPFTLQCALYAYALGGGLRAPAAIVALFSAIRLVQGASLIVLTVEIVVAVVAVLVPVWYYRSGAPTRTRQFAAALLASVLAFAGLVF